MVAAAHLLRYRGGGRRDHPRRRGDQLAAVLAGGELLAGLDSRGPRPHGGLPGPAPALAGDAMVRRRRAARARRVRPPRAGRAGTSGPVRHDGHTEIVPLARATSCRGPPSRPWPAWRCAGRSGSTAPACPAPWARRQRGRHQPATAAGQVERRRASAADLAGRPAAGSTWPGWTPARYAWPRSGTSWGCWAVSASASSRPPRGPFLAQAGASNPGTAAGISRGARAPGGPPPRPGRGRGGGPPRG